MKKKAIIGIALAAFALVQITAGVFSHIGFTVDDNYGGDLRLRRNEILCAHQGVNSFRIWNRDVTLPGFKPYGRPDKPNVPGEVGDRAVHAYTPVHTALFYFYGWLSERLCFSVMSCVFGFCLFFIVFESFRLSKERFGDTGGGARLLLRADDYFVLCRAVLSFAQLRRSAPCRSPFDEPGAREGA